MAKKNRIAVLGDGGWGTALSLLLDRKGCEAVLWSAFPDYAEVLKEKRENVKFLKGIPLPGSVAITADLDEAVTTSEMVIVAVPTQFLRNIIKQIRPESVKGKAVVSVAKGIEKKTLLCPSQIISGEIPSEKLAVLSGPSHAEEVARRLPCCVVVASKSGETAQQVQRILMDVSFRIYTSEDVIGVELGGAVKNVVAIAAGICDGLGFGSNAKAALLSRGLSEITRLGIALGARQSTFFGLSGLGDLVTTCISEYGRNRRVGELLGQGKRLEEILAGMEMVAEGIETARSVLELAAKQKIEMPIAKEVHRVLFEGKDPRQAVEELMLREPKMEMA